MSRVIGNQTEVKEFNYDLKDKAKEIHTNNAIISIHQFREAVNHVLELLRESEQSLRNFQKEYLRDEYDHLAEKHISQAWWHVAGIAGGAFEIASSFFQDLSSVFKGVGTAAIQSIGIGQKFGESDIILAQAATEETKKKIELLDVQDREAKQEIDEILRTTEKFIEALCRLMGSSVNGQ
jgi:hypothetical protein